MYVVQIMVTNINKDVVNSLLCGQLSLEMSRWTMNDTYQQHQQRNCKCKKQCVLAVTLQWMYRHRWRRAWTAVPYSDCCSNVYRSVIYTSCRRSSVRPYIRWSPGCCMNVAVWVPPGWLTLKLPTHTARRSIAQQQQQQRRQLWS